MCDGSEEGGLDALAITENGEFFVSGGEDQTLRLWSYDNGVVMNTGNGHSGSITKIQISPDQQTIVSCGSEGAVFMWQMPEEVLNFVPDTELPEPAVP